MNWPRLFHILFYLNKEWRKETEKWLNRPVKPKQGFKIKSDIFGKWVNAKSYFYSLHYFFSKDFHNNQFHQLVNGEIIFLIILPLMLWQGPIRYFVPHLIVFSVLISLKIRS